ncbi:MAG: IS66 family transposase [Acidobacteria bacterium]|nr:IS66 family transposase [Acidobacteriota bacterium]
MHKGKDLVIFAAMENGPAKSPFSEIPDEDWKSTPQSVKNLVVFLHQSFTNVVQRLQATEDRVKRLEEENQYLREQLARNSNNSSLPPSTDQPGVERNKKSPSQNKRGAQVGHKGHKRALIPPHQCQKVVDHFPKNCRRCGSELRGTDPHPIRHQVVEVPEIKPYVEEHRRHRLVCSDCGESSCGVLPDNVPHSGYGPRAVALVNILCGVYRTSERMAQQAMQDIFQIDLSVGAINSLRQEASRAVAAPVEEAREYIKQAKVVYADETGFPQGNSDGHNPGGRKGWLWVAVTTWVVAFRISLSRGMDSAKALLGEATTVVCDRWNAYNWVKERQLCWAHLKREFQKMAERSGLSQKIGQTLLAEEKKLFEYYHRVRDGTLQQSSFINYAGKIRQRIRELLEQGADYTPRRGDKSAPARTSRTCRDLLKVEKHMWLFVRRKDIEPTNNYAEHSVRHAVIWRKISMGSQSVKGSEYVARMMTVVMTLRKQKRNVLEFMTQAIYNARNNIDHPCLLPDVSLHQ